MTNAESFVTRWATVWRGPDSDPNLYMELRHDGCPRSIRSTRPRVRTCRSSLSRSSPWCRTFVSSQPIGPRRTTAAS